ncbi:MAG: hypothetical protein AAGI24_16110 [Pseudomonadota bacterium]
MSTNKRRGEPAIPSNWESLLTPDQLEGLRKLEGFGWALHVIRRPKFAPVEVLLKHSDGQCMQLLESGELEQSAQAPIRLDKPPEEEAPEDPWANATDDQGFELKEPAVPTEAPKVNNEPVPKSGGDNKRPPKILV